MLDGEEIARSMMELKFHLQIADLFDQWVAAKPALGIHAFCQCYVTFCQAEDMQQETNLRQFLTLVFSNDLHHKVETDSDESTSSESEN